MAYFGRTLEVCFGETLARFRPDLELIALVKDEWEEMGFMKPGSVPSEWRQRRVAVQVKIVSHLRFVDLESAKTIELLRSQLATQLIVLGHTDLDLALTKGKDRRVTRLISNWVFSQTDASGTPLYGGIRYLSRLDSKWECWAVFHDVEMEELHRLQILRADPHLRKVAKIYGLTIF